MQPLLRAALLSALVALCNGYDIKLQSNDGQPVDGAVTSLLAATRALNASQHRLQEALATTAAFLELAGREHSSAVEHITAGVGANHSAGAKANSKGCRRSVHSDFRLAHRQSGQTSFRKIANDDYFYYGTGASGCGRSSIDVCVVTALRVDPLADNAGSGYGQCTPPSDRLYHTLRTSERGSCLSGELRAAGLSLAQRAEVCCTPAYGVTGGLFCMAPATTVELQSSPPNAVPMGGVSINRVERLIENYPKPGWKQIVRWSFPGAVDYINPRHL
ncbi:unnamed protein product [Vitrella brassicaformis CCMP3155]|uniref:Uncharacterized protein n=1 Tax=Vitrella brassicaformis (strain CCMP3155) TaxID=1169540 RepID=A0A0G4EJ96_VITBC|nr:unnamed protein product [Vitrella brassicaformis CCMP3155]|eukprot:CEL97088.1 unnamed protein product [Vitrella brassicaformis CCMP3155]